MIAVRGAGKQSAKAINESAINPTAVRSEIERGVTAFAAKPEGGLIVTGSPYTAAYRNVIIALAARHRLPAVFPYRYCVMFGGSLDQPVVKGSECNLVPAANPGGIAGGRESRCIAVREHRDAQTIFGEENMRYALIFVMLLGPSFHAQAEALDREKWVGQTGKADKACFEKFRQKFGGTKNNNYAVCLTDQTNKEIDACIGNSEFSNCVLQRSLRVLEVCDLSKC